MPNRIIKESIHTSEKINRLTDFQFRLWVGLLTYVDDYGRGDARPPIIKGSVFPLRDRVTLKDIGTALTGLADAGCVGLYTVDGKPYLYLPNWEEHQRIRKKVSKFPEPPKHLITVAGCGKLPQVAADCGKVRPESESESESESEVEVESETRVTSPASASDDRIIAFDGSDITEASQRYDIADSMIHTYGLVDNDQTRDALIEDLEKHGEMKMREALKKAALSNSRNKVSVAFYRAVLNNTGSKAKGKPPDDGAYMRRKYNDNDFKAMEVDLDAES